MPQGQPYYGPLNRFQNRYELGQTYRRVNAARAAAAAARAAHNYARTNDVYRQAFQALKSWAGNRQKVRQARKPTANRAPPVRSKSTYKGGTNTPAVAKMAWSTGQSINRYKRPLKGTYSSKGILVVNKARGRDGARQKRKFSQSTYTTAFIGSTPNLDSAGNMGKLDERYTFPSVDSDHSTGWIYNVGGTSQYWNPLEKGKPGNQLIDSADSQNNFWLVNDANSDIINIDYMIKQQKLPETSTPFNTGELPVQHVYRTPNTILASVDLNLKFSAASVQDNIVTIQVVRATAPIPIIPGDLGHTEAESPFSTDKAKFMLTNSNKLCNGHYLQILYQKTFLLPGVNLNAKQPKSVYVRKKVKMNYLRSTCRRESSAAVDDLDYKLGGEWKAQFSIDETGAMFNNVYVKVISKCVTKTAKANMTVGENNGALGTVSKAYQVPTFHNMDSSTSPFEYTNMKNSRFRYGGTIGVKHYCQEISRGFGNSDMTAISQLNSNIIQLQDQVNELQTLAAEHADDTSSEGSESEHSDNQDLSDLGGAGDHHPDAPLATDHTHPFDGSATDHEATANGQVHSH